jgi:hypothetical protein
MDTEIEQLSNLHKTAQLANDGAVFGSSSPGLSDFTSLTSVGCTIPCTLKWKWSQVTPSFNTWIPHWNSGHIQGVHDELLGCWKIMLDFYLYFLKPKKRESNLTLVICNIQINRCWHPDYVWMPAGDESLWCLKRDIGAPRHRWKMCFPDYILSVPKGWYQCVNFAKIILL